MLLYWNQILQEPAIAVGILLAVLIGMTVHEFAHNYVAHLAGDPVPAREGRLTLDPSVHIYWPGFIMFVLIGFGILGTAPISAHRMRNPRWGYLAAVAAGPFSNLLVAIVFAILYRILGNFTLPPQIMLVLFFIVVFNLLLFIFNLLPFFPIDGWHIVLALLPPDLAHTWQRNAMTTQYILLGLILLSFLGGRFNLLSLIIGPPLDFLRQILLGF
ncbi:MAG: site-2 protease family protein [bacterium]|nr:site-2 protease family protein [bacterium]